MYGRMYLLRGPVSQSQVGLPVWIDSEVFYITRPAHFNAYSMNQTRTQIFEDGVWGGGGANIKYLTMTAGRGAGGGGANLKENRNFIAKLRCVHSVSCEKLHD